MHTNEIVLKSIIKSFMNNKMQTDGLKFKQQQLFTVNSTMEAKQFKLLVGGERIHSSELVHQMLNYDFLLKNANFSKKYFNLITSANLKNHFNSLTNVESKEDPKSFILMKEPLSKNYLQASCFMKIMKDALK